MSTNSNQEILKQKINEWALSPIQFIDDMWNLTPQPVKPEFTQAVNILVEEHDLEEIRAEYFEPFQKGLHITWQQWLILLAVEASISRGKSKRISIASAHGIGKSCTISWLLIWYLFTHFEAQIACTAPTSKQLFDVLWKEIAKWINRMPKGHQAQFEWQSTYIRMVRSPETWFASAKTARKESTEALAGVHGDHVMIISDEASGVEQEVFNTMEGSLTEKDILVLLISNPTRLSGYFYDTHFEPKIKEMWQRLQFGNLDSPVVRDDYEDYIIAKYGRSSDEYRIRVLGQFPNADSVDDKGYVALFNQSDLKQIDDDGSKIFHAPRLGLDPAEEGKNKTVWVLRDAFRAKIVLEEDISNPLKIVNRTIGLMEIYKLKAHQIDLDLFGTGGQIIKEFALRGYDIRAHNVGEKPKSQKDQDRFLNKRACWFFRVREWMRTGGEVVHHKEWSKQLMSIRYRRTTSSEKIQIMPKREMKKSGYYSPDHLDALMLTFSTSDNQIPQQTITPGMQTKTNDQAQTVHIKTNSSIHDAI